jgi:hypothetical protein
MEPETPRQCVIPLHKPSWKELIFFFASGLLVSIPFVAFYESLVPAAFSVALLIVILAPFIEELAKVFPLFYRQRRNRAVTCDAGAFNRVGFWRFRIFLSTFSSQTYL